MRRRNAALLALRLARSHHSPPTTAPVVAVAGTGRASGRRSSSSGGSSHQRRDQWSAFRGRRLLELAVARGAEARARDGVRVRFAPSPTGELHLGGLRTALCTPATGHCCCAAVAATG
jgi:hypothetical protein